MTGNKIHIYPISNNAVKELRALSCKTFYDSFASANTPENMQHYLDTALSEDTLMKELNNPDTAFYFAALDGRNIGYFKINSGPAQKEQLPGNNMELERIYVIKEMQGKNIGQVLLDKVIELAKQRKCDCLWLGVWEKNTGAIRFYERNGFQSFDKHVFMLGEDEQTDILMKLVLQITGS